MAHQVIETAEHHLRSHFGNARRVGDRSVLSELRKDDTTVAAYWFDFRDDLPSSSKQLQEYVDKLIGPTYFSDDRPSDLRWNHYIYFVMGDTFFKKKDHEHLSGIAESDRSFARKFVVPASDFISAVADIGRIGVFSSANPHATSIVDTWRSALDHAGLPFLVDDDIAMKDRVRRLCDEPTKRSPKAKKPPQSQSGHDLGTGQIAWIDLSKFRPHPSLTRVDGLGTVNLIYGPNGAGKTSLMEAIEYLYCGGNLRNPGHRGFEVTAGLKHGAEVTTTWQNDFKESRARLAEWYAQRDSSKKNALPSAFGRFNFLNTDAAAALTLGRRDLRGDEREDILQALNQLIGGEEASSLEKQLVRMSQEIASERRTRSSAADTLRSELASVNNEMSYINSRPAQVDADASLLREQLQAIRWIPDIPQDGEQSYGQLRKSLHEVAMAMASILEIEIDHPPQTPRDLSQMLEPMAMAEARIDSERLRLRAREDESQRLRAFGVAARAWRDARSSFD